MGVVGLVLVNFAWNQAGVVTWTTEPYVWVLLIIGILFLVGFFFVEFKVATYPLLPFDAFTGDVGCVLACVACGWGCFGVWVYYLWNFFLVLRHATPIQAAAWAVPLILSGGTAAIVTGFLLSRIRAAWVMLIALIAFCVGTILIATAPVGQTYWAQTFVCTMSAQTSSREIQAGANLSCRIIPWGMDMSFPSATVILSNSVPKVCLKLVVY